jgi:hypothetical protein
LCPDEETTDSSIRRTYPTPRLKNKRLLYAMVKKLINHKSNIVLASHDDSEIAFLKDLAPSQEYIQQLPLPLASP